MTTETKKGRQFADIIAKLDKIDDKLDEVLQRLPPSKPRDQSAIVGKESENDYLLSRL
jgi:hypothetical protein